VTSLNQASRSSTACPGRRRWSLSQPRLAHRTPRTDRRARTLTRGELAVARTTGGVGAAMSWTRSRMGHDTGGLAGPFPTLLIVGGGAHWQASGPPRKRLQPFKSSTCVQVANQSCRSGRLRELEQSRLELDVTSRPGRVGRPVHASLCAVIAGHPPFTRDPAETQNSSVEPRGAS
jgi:hypothetical protein